MSGSYDVVLLVEQALTVEDARQVLSLHDELDDPVVYHVLLPLEDAAARIEASMGGLAGGELMGNPTLGLHEVDVEAVRKDSEERSHDDLTTTLAALREAGGTADGKVVGDDPIDALAAEVSARRRPRGDHPHPPPRGGRVLPPRLDVPGPPQDRRPRAAPARARELRRAGGQRRGCHRPLRLAG